MTRRLSQRLHLGGLVATSADDGSFPRVAAAIRGSLDYFQRTERKSTPEKLAADLLGDALADATRRLFLLEDAEGGGVGLLDLALESPAPGEATVALLVLDRKLRGTGLGREIAEALFATLSRAGFSHVRLGVAPGEVGAAHFWNAVGMWPCGVESGVRLFERALP